MKTRQNKETRSGSGLFDDTIAAIATAPGTGGVAIVRVSGPDAVSILHTVMPAHGQAVPGMMVYGDILDGERKIDSGYGVFFRGPHSYTGEDTAEIQCHGGAVITGLVLASVLKAGARAALPGEFTKRAFLNGRMDLSQAQAVGDLIGAVSASGAELARRNIKGALKNQLIEAQTMLTDTVARLEAALEYPDEDEVEIDVGELVPSLAQIGSMLERTAATWGKGHILKDGLRVVLVGAPNAGKSSLFNALCRTNRSIVATVPGTTRDVVESTIMSVEGSVIVLADTAGLHVSDDPVEREGMARARVAVEDSDVVVMVVDGSQLPQSSDKELVEDMRRSGKQIIGVLSKSDLPAAMSHASFEEYFCLPFISVSAQTQNGLDDLERELYETAGGNVLAEETVLISDLRQREHLERAAQHIRSAMDTLQGLTPDLACIDFRAAWREIGAIVGNTAEEEIIDRIFSKFCLGK